jgi:ssDNA-binding Zn-finger/Zn-ribbon topoisomerase 1
LTTVKLPFESRYVVKTGRIQGKIPYPYLLRDDDFKVGLPPEITIEEIEEEYISEVEDQQEKSLKKERIVAKCPECSSSIFIKLGPNGSFYIQHGIKEKGVRQEKCVYKNLIGPIFEDEDPDSLNCDDAIKRFNLSTKNPRFVCEEGGWSYMTAVGPYGGFAIKQKNREVFDFDELAKMKKNEILELISSEKYQSVLNLINLNPVKIPKSLTKELLLEKIRESFLIDEKIIKKLSKDELVNLAKLLEIVFYRGRFRMKVDDATKNNLINKITIEKKNKPLDTPQKALTIQSDEILDLFGTQK